MFLLNRLLFPFWDPLINPYPLPHSDQRTNMIRNREQIDRTFSPNKYSNITYSNYQSLACFETDVTLDCWWLMEMFQVQCLRGQRIKEPFFYRFASAWWNRRPWISGKHGLNWCRSLSWCSGCCGGNFPFPVLYLEVLSIPWTVLEIYHPEKKSPKEEHFKNNMQGININTVPNLFPPHLEERTLRWECSYAWNVVNMSVRYVQQYMSATRRKWHAPTTEYSLWRF